MAPVAPSRTSTSDARAVPHRIAASTWFQPGPSSIRCGCGTSDSTCPLYRGDTGLSSRAMNATGSSRSSTVQAYARSCEIRGHGSVVHYDSAVEFPPACKDGPIDEPAKAVFVLRDNSWRPISSLGSLIS